MSVGKHIILDLYEVNTTILQNINTSTLYIFNDFIDHILKTANVHLLSKNIHFFDFNHENKKIDGAFTALYLLSESHLSIHTWPEKNYIAIEESFYTLTFISLIEEFNENLKIDDSHTYFYKCVMICFFQIMIITLVIFQLFFTGSNSEKPNADPTLIMMSLRLIVCYLFHIGVSNKVKNAYRRLKFLKNNMTRFKVEFQF